MPRIWIAEIEDRTPAGDFAYIGTGIVNRGAFVRPPVDAIADAVRLEAGRLGLKLVDTRAQAEAVLRTALVAARSSLPPNVIASGVAVNAPVTAAITLAVELRSLAGELLWSASLTGKGSKAVFSPGRPGTAPNVAMNLALADVMNRLGRALEDEGALNQVFARKSAVAAAPAAEAPPAVRARSSDLDALPPAAPIRTDRHAVVIGIERYRGTLPTADFAAGDARIASQYLKRVLGIPDSNVALLTDENATRGDFEKYIERWLPNRVKAGDEVYVYYSGHGAPNAATGDAYLVPYDGDPTYVEETGYPLRKLYEKLGRLPAKSVFLAMDSCFSGAGGRSVLAQGARPLVTMTESGVPRNLTVMSASAGNQISNSYAEKGHGLFTYFFLKGLKEKGTDLRAVFSYLKPQVSDVARRDYNADQEPQWREGR